MFAAIVVSNFVMKALVPEM